MLCSRLKFDKMFDFINHYPTTLFHATQMCAASNLVGKIDMDKAWYDIYILQGTNLRNNEFEGATATSVRIIIRG
jgi:hypothetical protein